MAAVTICSDSRAQENKVCHCFHCFPIYLPWSDRTGCHDLSFLNAEFWASFSLSSRSSLVPLFSAVRAVSSVYLRLLIFLPAILILPCASSDKMWSTGEGNGKPPWYSYLENPTNSMKRQTSYYWKVCLWSGCLVVHKVCTWGYLIMVAWKLVTNWRISQPSPGLNQKRGAGAKRPVF